MHQQYWHSIKVQNQKLTTPEHMDMKKAILLTVSILVPQFIFADAGTPLMWASILQLIWGNVLIGIVEGLFIKFVYKAKLLRSILIMILANYVSWIAGYFLIDLYQNLFINTVFDIKFVFEAWITSLIVLYLITVLLEAGFVYWIFRRNKTYKTSVIISSIVNLISYTGIIIIYLQCSSYTFFSKTQIDQTLLDKRNEKLIIYYIDRKGKSVNTYDFDSKTIHKITDIDTNLKYPTLKLISNREDSMVHLFLVYYC